MTLLYVSVVKNRLPGDPVKTPHSAGIQIHGTVEVLGLAHKRNELLWMYIIIFNS